VVVVVVVVVEEELVEVVELVVVLELVVVGAVVVDDARTWVPSTWVLGRLADALGIAAATTMDTTMSAAHASARKSGCRFIDRSRTAARKCTKRTGAGDTRTVPRSQDGGRDPRDAGVGSPPTG
jgi:hypothetical protein